MEEPLSEHAIEAALRGRFGKPLRVLEETTSTNSEALEWADRGASDGALVVAEHQTRGRGRHGRSWRSSPRRSLLFSLVLRPDVDVDAVELLTTALGVACAEGLHSRCGLAARLKWPNDVTVDGYKLAGILVETRVKEARAEVAVAGLGVNVGWPETRMSIGDRAATSVAAETKRAPSRATLLGAILDAFEHRYGQVLDRSERDDLLRRATELSAVLGHEVSISLPNGESLRGTATALTPSGALELATSEGRVALTMGEIDTVHPL